MSEKIKIIKLIHLAICSGTILVYVFAGQVSIHKIEVPNIDSSSILYLAIPFIALGLSHFLFQSQLKQIDRKQKLEDNLTIYQTASLVRWSILEGAAFLILFSKPDFVLFGILIIVYLVYIRPTEERIKSDLQ